MRTIEKGDICVAMMTASFLKRSYVVLKPLSENSRYDLVIDRGSGFERIQCKTGRLRRGAVSFNACSSTMHRKGGTVRDYRGQADWFGVFCPDNGECYLVPVEAVGLRRGSLRVDEAKNNQRSGVRMAAAYRLL